MAVDWEGRARAAEARFTDGAARLPDNPAERQRQLTRMGNAAWATGLCRLMAGRDDEAAVWLVRAAETYRRSWEDAPPESWGRPIGAMKARLVAGDLAGARDDAQWALEAGAARAASPIGRYSAVLALLVRTHDDEAALLAETLRGSEGFPPVVADALVALGRGDADAYAAAITGLLADFEQREEFLEDVPVADTVLALQTLAGERGLGRPLTSPVLPAS